MATPRLWCWAEAGKCNWPYCGHAACQPYERPETETAKVDENREHVMTYRAGTRGLSGLGLPDGEPGWSCPCGNWAFQARAMPRRKTGNNQVEALKSYRAHVAASVLAAQPSPEPAQEGQ